MSPAEPAGGRPRSFRGTGPASARGPGGRPWWHCRRGFVVAGLLAWYAVTAWTASLSKGVSFDEGMQLAVGYNIWLNSDYRIEGANGDLVKRWATLPYLITRPRFVDRDNPYWKGGGAYELGRQFLFELGNRPELLLAQSRAMITLLGVAAALLVYRVGRSVAGPGAGVLALTLFAFSPHMLAFGGVVSTDLSITLLLFASTCLVWLLLHQVTPVRLAISLGVTGLMVLAKPTALVIVPITAVLVAAKLIVRRPLVVRGFGFRRVLAARQHQAAVFAFLTVLHVAAGWSAIWAHYGFRHVASPAPDDPAVVSYRASIRDQVPHVLATTVAWLHRTRLLPEGFIHGLDTLLTNDDALGSFMQGRHTMGGTAGFFPYAIWVKTHPVLFGLVAMAGVAWWRVARRTRPAAGRPRRPAVYPLLPHVALIGCYLAIAITEDLNLGHRHVLPIYPSLYVLAGGAALLAARPARRWLRVALGAGVAWLAADTLMTRPHFLAYFGPQAGGSDSGYRHLVDSSLDWGMDLPSLQQWLARHNPGDRETVWLAYFGTDRPEHHGINAKRLPGFFDNRAVELHALSPGYYVISASLLQGVYTAAFGPWNRHYEERYQRSGKKLAHIIRTVTAPRKPRAAASRWPRSMIAQEFDEFENLRFARLCAWLRQQGDPPHHVGHSMFIWKLDQADLRAALVGPPVEMAEAQPIIRRFRDLDAPTQ